MNSKLVWALALLSIQIVAFPIVRMYSLYNRFWFADIALHVEAGLMFGFFWLWLIRKINLSTTLTLLTILMAGVFGSFLWELWEFSGWTVVGRAVPNYIPTLTDTLGDMTAGLVGSLVLCIYMVLRKKQ